jgi:hypothetical protein
MKTSLSFGAPDNEEGDHCKDRPTDDRDPPRTKWNWNQDKKNQEDKAPATDTASR